MRIECPYCGERDLSEFHCLGGTGPGRPEPDSPDAVARFGDYVYLRENPAGPHEEFWYHGFGCRAWLVVARNTLTHEIVSVRAAAPQEAGSPR